MGHVMDFGSRLRQARREAGMSQKELGGDRCSTSYVSHVESGKRMPTLDLIAYFEGRLNLPPGSLGQVQVGPTVARRRRANTNAIQVLETLMRYRREGRHADAKRFAETLPAHLTPDMDWLIARQRVEIAIDGGLYHEAASLTQELIAIAEGEDSPGLLMIAETLSAIAWRVVGDTARARRSAQRAADLAATYPEFNIEERAEAFIAALAAGGDAAANAAAALEEMLTDLPDGATRANTLWALGTYAFQSNSPHSGMELHDRAAELFSPERDLRSWVRFPRASAEARLRSGFGAGVEELLAQARERHKVRRNVEEGVALTLTEAAYASHCGDNARAESMLANVDLSSPEITARIRGSVQERIAALLSERGEVAEARAAALEAAASFTEAGDLEDAQQAWKFLRSLPESA